MAIRAFVSHPPAAGRHHRLHAVAFHGVYWRVPVSHLRFILATARVAAAVALVALVIKIAPTLVDHAAGHSGTYASQAAAAAPRTR